MKTKFQVIALCAGVLAYAQTASAKVKDVNDQRIVAILNNNSLTSVKAMPLFAVAGNGAEARQNMQILASNSPDDGITSAEGYHHGGGGGSDGTKWFLDIGVGFGGGLSGGGGFGADITAGTSGSSLSYSATPGILFTLDKKMNDNFHVGFIFDYQSVTISENYTTQVFEGYDPNTGLPIYQNQSYTDKYSITFESVAARLSYHFSTGNDKLDPYIVAMLGYVIGSVSYSSNDPNALSGVGFSAAGLLAGGAGGIRYYFTDHIGVWAELGWATNYGFNIGNLGLAIKF